MLLTAVLLGLFQRTWRRRTIRGTKCLQDEHRHQVPWHEEQPAPVCHAFNDGGEDVPS